MTKRRKRFKQTTPLVERLHQFAEAARAEASRLPDCAVRRELLQKIEVSNQAERMEGFLRSRELMPPS